MLLVIILAFLLIGNWLLSETLVFIPMHSLTQLSTLTSWGFGCAVVLFLAWCMSDD